MAHRNIFTNMSLLMVHIGSGRTRSWSVRSGFLLRLVRCGSSYPIRRNRIPNRINLRVYICIHLKVLFACNSHATTYIATWHTCKVPCQIFQFLSIDRLVDFTRVQCGCSIHIQYLMLVSHLGDSNLCTYKPKPSSRQNICYLKWNFYS